MDIYSKTVDEVLVGLDTSRSGLSRIEVNERQKQHGRNVIRLKTKPLWQILLQPFASIFMVVLLIAALISFWEHAVIDGIIILIVVGASAVMDYVQQYSTGRILRALRTRDQQQVYVRRDGKEQLVEVTELVPGDIVLLREGDKVPADVRIIESENTKVNESQLTGESLPISKDALPVSGKLEVYEQTNMLFQGSFMVGGKATVVVATTGNATEFGRMAALSTERLRKSPVEQKIDVIIGQIILIVGIITVLVFGLLLLRGLDVMEAIRFTIAIAVSAVPEGLPVSISVVIAAGMRELAKRQALVRNSAAMESIGVITTIATDKTGTLTKNQLTIQEFWAPHNKLDDLQQTMVRAAFLSNDPLDQALLDFATTHNIAHKHAPAKLYEFEHELSLSGTARHNGEAIQLYLKGSPEAILHHCTLSANEHEKAIAELHHLTGLGYRVLAFAHTEQPTMPKSLYDLPKKARFTFAGFVAIADALRPEAKPAIMRAQAAGISVRMITGDHFETAFHIGKQLGLVTARNQVFDSREMPRLSDEQLAAVIKNTYVFSRVTPEHKHRLLSILKTQQITAMTGDGVNDVPALTNAHVGIAMGSGSDIAKDAGDIILLNDNFKTIVDAVSIGRTLYANIRRMVAFMLATNIGEIAVSILALLCGTPLPLVPIQILWINLVTDTTTVIPLGLEPEHANAMKMPPVKPSSPLLSKFVIGQIVVVAASLTAVTFGLYLYALHTQGPQYASTLAFWAIAASQWGVIFGMRATLTPVWQLLHTKNTAFYLGVGASILLQCIVMFTPLGHYLHLTAISGYDIAIATVISVTVPLVILETYKYIGRTVNATV